MFHELRIYQPAPGRLADLVERIGSDMAPYFERHGFPPRLGQWTTAVDAPSPRFAWLLAWPDLAERSAAFARLDADADWQALRRKTNGPGEMVLRYDLRFLAPARAWPAQLERDERTRAWGLCELRVHPVAVGRTRVAGQVLAEVDLPALAASGTTVLGVYDNVCGGPATPGISMLLGWRDEVHRRAAMAAYEGSAEVLDARRAERAQWSGEQVLGEADSLLLVPTRHGVAPRWK